MVEASDRAAWLAARLPNVLVLDQVPPDALTGEHPDRLGDLVGVVTLVAECLQQIHALPTEDFPFRSGWDALEAEMLASADLDPTSLPEPYCRYDLPTLHRLWREGRPEVEDLVVCHGQPQLSRMVFGDGSLDAITGVERLCVADRHLDLAIAHLSIQTQLGPEAVFAFYDAYDPAPDLVRLDHYVMASHLW